MKYQLFLGAQEVCPLENLITRDQCGLRWQVIGIIIEEALWGLGSTSTSTSLAVDLDGGRRGRELKLCFGKRLRRMTLKQALPCNAEFL